MPLRSLFVIVLIVACITPPIATRAQSPDVAAIMARVRADRALQRTKSLAASMWSSAIVIVRDSTSRIDVIKPQTIVHESYGVYHRDPDLGVRMRIVAARGTASLGGLPRGPIENFSSIGELIELSDERILILNTLLVSPLATDADAFYSFEYSGTERRLGIEVDVIRAVPASSLRPLFDGRLFVSRSTSSGTRGTPDDGALVAMELRPSASTAIPFITDLRIVQTFAQDADGASFSDSLQITGSGVVRFAAFGLAETHVDFTIASNLEQQTVGVRMPDSLRSQGAVIVVRDDATDAPSTFWSSHSSLASAQVEAIEASRASVPKSTSALSFSFGGMLDYNRAGGATPTLSAGAAMGPIDASVSGGYSFGLERPVGEGAVTLTLGHGSPMRATVRGTAFSMISTTTTGDRTYPRVMNMLVASTLHQDYYNYFRKDGWNAGADVGYGKLKLGATFEQSRHFSIGNNARWALLTWSSKEFPVNPPITEGAYTTIQGDISFAQVSPFLKLTPIADGDFRFSLTGLHGSRAGADTTFQLLEALTSYSFPLVETGYNPVTLTLLGAAGAGSVTLPPQYQFRLRTSAATFGKPGGLISPPKGLYGGTEYIAVGAEVNLTDLPWRALGLPTVNGRGIELIVGAASARYRQAHPVGYIGTGDDWYSEVGLGFSRIPLFLTGIVFGRADIRRGLGPLGKFGGNFTFVLPL